MNKQFEPSDPTGGAPPASDDQAPAGDPFFCEVREDLRCEESGGAEEYLLRSIDAGRRIVSISRVLLRECPDVARGDFRPRWEEPQTYVDLIEDILQAATEAGVDAEPVCARALRAQQHQLAEVQWYADPSRQPETVSPPPSPEALSRLRQMMNPLLEQRQSEPEPRAGGHGSDR